MFLRQPVKPGVDVNQQKGLDSHVCMGVTMLHADHHDAARKQVCTPPVPPAFPASKQGLPVQACCPWVHPTPWVRAVPAPQMSHSHITVDAGLMQRQKQLELGAGLLGPVWHVRSGSLAANV